MSCRLRIGCVGDSLTRGDGLHEHPPKHRVPANRLREKQRPLRERGNYPAVLQRLVGKRFDVRNYGHGGATACAATGGQGPPYNSTREYAAALRFEPNVVVLMLGTNDAKRHFYRSYACGHDGRGLRAGLVDIIANFARSPNPPRLLLLLPPPEILVAKVWGIEQALLVEARRVVAEVGQQQHSSAASMEVALAPPLPIPARQALYTDDLLHLNANGSALLACAVHAELDRRRALRCPPRSRRGEQEEDAPALGRGRSCFDPFCVNPADVPWDDGGARWCDDESGVDAPFMYTGMPCVLPKLSAAAHAACERLRQAHGVAAPEEATRRGAAGEPGRRRRPRGGAVAAEASVAATAATAPAVALPVATSDASTFFVGALDGPRMIAAPLEMGDVGGYVGAAAAVTLPTLWEQRRAAFLVASFALLLTVGVGARRVVRRWSRTTRRVAYLSARLTV